MQDEIKLVFDQTVKWDDEVAGRFYLDGVPAEVIAVGGTGKVITLKLAGPSTAKTLTYIKGGRWKQEEAIIQGENNIAALTFCEVPISNGWVANLIKYLKASRSLTCQKNDETGLTSVLEKFERSSG